MIRRALPPLMSLLSRRAPACLAASLAGRTAARASAQGTRAFTHQMRRPFFSGLFNRKPQAPKPCVLVEIDSSSSRGLSIREAKKSGEYYWSGGVPIIFVKQLHENESTRLAIEQFELMSETPINEMAKEHVLKTFQVLVPALIENSQLGKQAFAVAVPFLNEFFQRLHEAACLYPELTQHFEQMYKVQETLDGALGRIVLFNKVALHDYHGNLALEFEDRQELKRRIADYEKGAIKSDNGTILINLKWYADQALERRNVHVINEEIYTPDSD